MGMVTRKLIKSAKGFIGPHFVDANVDSEITFDEKYEKGYEHMFEPKDKVPAKSETRKAGE